VSDTPDLRASDADRDAAIARLRDAAGEGRLTLDELTERVEAATAARTQGELATLTADLPAVGAVAPSVVAPAAAGGPISQSSVFGDLKRSGVWTIPVDSQWGTVFGDVVLDLRQGRIPAGELHVHATSVFGDIDLLVPEGVAVEVRSRTTFGDVRQETSDSGVAGAPRIVLTGRTMFGDVKVRHATTPQKLLRRLKG
jgi:hypothetical protein